MWAGGWVVLLVVVLWGSKVVLDLAVSPYVQYQGPGSVGIALGCGVCVALCQPPLWVVVVAVSFVAKVLYQRASALHSRRAVQLQVDAHDPAKLHAMGLQIPSWIHFSENDALSCEWMNGIVTQMWRVPQHTHARAHARAHTQHNTT